MSCRTSRVTRHHGGIAYRIDSYVKTDFGILSSDPGTFWVERPMTDRRSILLPWFVGLVLVTLGPMIASRGYVGPVLAGPCPDHHGRRPSNQRPVTPATPGGDSPWVDTAQTTHHLYEHRRPPEAVTHRAPRARIGCLAPKSLAVGAGIRSLSTGPVGPCRPSQPVPGKLSLPVPVLRARTNGSR